MALGPLLAIIRIESGVSLYFLLRGTDLEAKEDSEEESIVGLGGEMKQWATLCMTEEF